MPQAQSRSALTRLARLRKAVEELIAAEIVSSWIGGGDPADIPRIESELIEARIAYEVALHEVVK